jgi:hypothetical protein
LHTIVAAPPQLDQTVADHPGIPMGGMGAYLESRPPEWQASDLVFIGENI